MLLSLWCLLLLVYAGLAEPTKQIIHRSNKSFHEKNIFVLAGQSNMAGRGGVYNQKWDRIVPPECKPNSAILRLNSKLKWEEAKEPLHFDIDVTQTCGIGPGMSFANTLLREMNNSSIGIVGLVPCAVGGSHGTKISEWGKGTYLYNQLINRSKSSVKEGGSIRAILWFQGESDTVIKEDAQMYSKNLKKLILNLRSDLKLPKLPFIQVALASGQGSYIDIVRKSQLELKLPYVRCVDANGVPLEPDHVHLSTQAQVRVGQMLAKAYFSFNNSRVSSSSEGAKAPVPS